MLVNVNAQINYTFLNSDLSMTIPATKRTKVIMANKSSCYVLKDKFQDTFMLQLL